MIHSERVISSKKGCFRSKSIRLPLNAMTVQEHQYCNANKKGQRRNKIKSLCLVANLIFFCHVDSCIIEK